MCQFHLIGFPLKPEKVDFDSIEKVVRREFARKGGVEVSRRGKNGTILEFRWDEFAIRVSKRSGKKTQSETREIAEKCASHRRDCAKIAAVEEVYKFDSNDDPELEHCVEYRFFCIAIKKLAGLKIFDTGDCTFLDEDCA